MTVLNNESFVSFFTVPSLIMVIFLFYQEANIRVVDIPGGEEITQFIHMSNYAFKIDYYKNNKIAILVLLTWVIGIIIVGYLHLKALHKTKKWILQGAVENSYLTKLANELCKEVGILSEVKVLMNTNIASPCLLSINKPTIVMSLEFDNHQENKDILLHELIHYKRQDSLFNLVSKIFCAIYWFNPIFYLLDSNLNLFCEMACDEEVIANFDDQRKAEYVKDILQVLQSAVYLKQTSTNVSFVNQSERKLKRRIEHIMKYKKTVFKTTFSIVLSIIIISCLPITVMATSNLFQRITDSLIPDPFANDQYFSGPNVTEGEIYTIYDFDKENNNETMELFDLSLRTSKINETLSKNNKIQSTTMSLTRGDNVLILLLGDPTNVSFSVILLGATVVEKDSSNGHLSVTFDITESGNCTIYLRNNSATSSVTIKGM